MEMQNIEPEQIEITPSESDNKKETQKHPPLLKRLRIISYVRELSIVIIGVLSTLFITGLINDYNRQKELDGMLKLVKEGLNESLTKLYSTQHRWEDEQYMFALLKKNINDIEQIPVDTLQKYNYVIGALYSYEPESEAYDVLKGSVLLQYIEKKELIADISRVYKRLQLLNAQLTRYSEQKMTASYPLLTNLNSQETDQWLSGSIYDSYRFPLREKRYRAFLTISKTILNEHIFDSCAEDIKKAIVTMEQNGY